MERQQEGGSRLDLKEMQRRRGSELKDLLRAGGVAVRRGGPGLRLGSGTWILGLGGEGRPLAGRRRWTVDCGRMGRGTWDGGRGMCGREGVGVAKRAAG